MNIKNIVLEEIIKSNEEIQQFIDVIDLNPDDPKYSKYIELLKQKYGVKYVRPEIRYKKDIDIINSININKEIKTNNLTLTIISEKITNLLNSLQIIALHENEIVGRAGFNIKNNVLKIGGAEVIPEYRRQGVYSEIINVIEEIALKYNLEIIESGRSDDAKKFWKNRLKL